MTQLYVRYTSKHVAPAQVVAIRSHVTEPELFPPHLFEPLSFEGAGRFNHVVIFCGRTLGLEQWGTLPPTFPGEASKAMRHYLSHVAHVESLTSQGVQIEIVPRFSCEPEKIIIPDTVPACKRFLSYPSDERSLEK